MEEAVIFDFDGTLIDLLSHISWSRIRKDAIQGYRDFSVPIRLLSDYTDPFKLYGDMYKPNMKDKAGDSFYEAQKEVSNVLAEYERRAMDKASVLPGCEDILTWLSENDTKIGVVSLNNGRVIGDILEENGLKRYIDAIFSRESEGRNKPFPDHIINCLNEFSVDSQDAVMIGDSPSDVLMSKKANVMPIGVTTGAFLKEELEMAGSEAVFSDLNGVKDFLS